MRTRPRPLSADDLEHGPPPALLLASCWDWACGSARDEEGGHPAAPEQEEQEEGEGPEPLCFWLAPAPQPPPWTTAQDETALQLAHPGGTAAAAKGRGFAAACMAVL